MDLNIVSISRCCCCCWYFPAAAAAVVGLCIASTNRKVDNFKSLKIYIVKAC